MSKSKLFNSIDLSNYNSNLTNLIFFTTDSKFNFIRSKFNQLAPSNIKLYDISDNLKLNTPEYNSQISISVSNKVSMHSDKIINISKSCDDRFKHNIGWQRHLNHGYGKGFSIGHLRGLGKNMEPIFRDKEHFQFNLDAIRRSDIPNHTYSSPTGFTIEEACQIARYIGTSTEIKSFNLVCTQETISDNMAEAMATMLWYLFEGLAIPKNHPAHSDEFSEFIVMLKDETYSFYQSNINGKWWVKISDHFHPCSFEEYQNFTKGKISNRLLDILE